MKRKYYFFESFCGGMLALMIILVSFNTPVQKIAGSTKHVEGTFLKGDEFIRFAGPRQNVISTTPCVKKAEDNAPTIDRLLNYLADGLMNCLKKIMQLNNEVTGLPTYNSNNFCYNKQQPQVKIIKVKQC